MESVLSSLLTAQIWMDGVWKSLFITVFWSICGAETQAMWLSLVEEFVFESGFN